MADVTAVAVGATTVGANYNKFAINTSDAGRELVLSATKTNMTDADLLAVYRQLTQAGGAGTGADTDGPDAFTFAGFGTADGTAFVSGTTDVAFFRVQGTGTANTTTVSGVALAVVAIFAPAR
jgi:hypothetical protein